MRACSATAAAALVLGDAAGVEEGRWRVVDADPELDRDRHRPGGLDRRAHDATEQLRFDRERGAAAVAGHLLHRAAEVHVDVVDAARRVDQLLDGLADGGRVGAVELDAAGRLVGGERGELEALAVPLDEARAVIIWLT